jgi:hypothetical protein
MVRRKVNEIGAGGSPAAAPPDRPESEIREQVPNLDPQRSRDPPDVQESRVPLAPLDAADIGAMQAALVRKPFLGQTLPLA